MPPTGAVFSVQSWAILQGLLHLPPAPWKALNSCYHLIATRPHPPLEVTPCTHTSTPVIRDITWFPTPFLLVRSARCAFQAFAYAAKVSIPPFPQFHGFLLVHVSDLIGGLSQRLVLSSSFLCCLVFSDPSALSTFFQLVGAPPTPAPPRTLGLASRPVPLDAAASLSPAWLFS